MNISFPHGMGDCANFAQCLPLWTRRGHDIRVTSPTAEEKEPLFRAAGIEAASGALVHHPYYHPHGVMRIGLRDSWACNKVAHNLTASPMPDIGGVEELWNELLGVRLSLADQLTPGQRQRIDGFVEGLGKYVCVHTRGNTSQAAKNFTAELEQDTYRELLEQTDGKLLLLDWDDRVTRLDHRRVVHLSELGHVRPTELWYLLSRASCFVGVDSGPYHLCRFTDTPCVGVWFGHHPARFAIPRELTANLVDGRHGEWNSKRRHSFNLVEVGKITGAEIASCAGKLLGGMTGTDVAFDSVLAKLRQPGREGLYLDRERTFREALAGLCGVASPVIVETGCIRAVEDWTAGFSTYVFGWFCRDNGGTLDSVDLDFVNCAFAREWSSPFPVRVHQSDSVGWLAAYSGKPIDLLYLDSLDTDQPEHAEHCLEELKRGLPLLSATGRVLIDDTPYHRGNYTGKGALAVPFLVGQGWRIHESSGYQVLLQRGDN